MALRPQKDFLPGRRRFSASTNQRAALGPVTEKLAAPFPIFWQLPHPAATTALPEGAVAYTSKGEAVTMALVVAQPDVDYTIKPQATTPAVDTSDWPLLLKNYDKRRTF